MTRRRSHRKDSIRWLRADEPIPPGTPRRYRSGRGYIWSAAAAVVTVIAADVLRDRRRERLIDRKCAEFAKTLEESW